MKGRVGLKRPPSLTPGGAEEGGGIRGWMREGWEATMHRNGSGSFSQNAEDTERERESTQTKKNSTWTI